LLDFTVFFSEIQQAQQGRFRKAALLLALALELCLLPHQQAATHVKRLASNKMIHHFRKDRLK